MPKGAPLNFETTGVRTVGFLGFGEEAKRTYVPVLRALGYSIEAACDPMPQRPRLFPTYTTASDMLAHHECDLIIICADPRAHVELVEQCLRRRTNILCEKPLIADGKKVRSLHEQALETEAALRVVDNWRYSRGLQVFLYAVGSCLSFASPPYSLRIEIARPANKLSGWRLSPEAGGLLWEYGWHAIYIAASVHTVLHPQGNLCGGSMLVHDVENGAALAILRATFSDLGLDFSVMRSGPIRMTKISCHDAKGNCVTWHDGAPLQLQCGFQKCPTLAPRFQTSSALSLGPRTEWLYGLMSSCEFTARETTLSMNTASMCASVLSKAHNHPNPRAAV